MKIINDRDRVDQQTLKVYNDINGLDVIEQLLLFKGIEGREKCVPIKDLEYMALIHYSLKVNQTNKLYVGWYLNKFFRREGLLLLSGKISVPSSILEKAKNVHSQFKNSKA